MLGPIGEERFQVNFTAEFVPCPQSQITPPGVLRTLLFRFFVKKGVSPTWTSPRAISGQVTVSKPS